MTIAMDRAQELLLCFQNELQAPHPTPIAPEHVMLRPGQEVTPLLSTNSDECCRGLGWVRIASVSGVRQINSTAAEDARCFGQERVLTLELGTARCAPTPGAGGIPSEDEWTAVALTLLTKSPLTIATERTRDGTGDLLRVRGAGRRGRG